MIAVLQRIKSASVIADGEPFSSCERGFLVLLGVSFEDDEQDARLLADKISKLRVFTDSEDKMNLSLIDTDGELLVISQFTLYADCKSRRPGFTGAARPETAIPLYEKFMSECRDRGFQVEHGEFGADMQVFSQNDGPVTILLDTDTL